MTLRPGPAASITSASMRSVSMERMASAPRVRSSRAARGGGSRSGQTSSSACGRRRSSPAAGISRPTKTRGTRAGLLGFHAADGGENMGTLMAVLTAMSVMADPAPAAAPALTDPQIATVALTAHRIDIERGKLAQKKTRNEEVKQFADQMVTDHGQGEK